MTPVVKKVTIIAGPDSLPQGEVDGPAMMVSDGKHPVGFLSVLSGSTENTGQLQWQESVDDVTYTPMNSGAVIADSGAVLYSVLPFLRQQLKPTSVYYRLALITVGSPLSCMAAVIDLAAKGPFPVEN